MLTIENYYYSHEKNTPVTDTYEFQDDDLLEVEINIRYPIRINVKKLKEALVEEELTVSDYGELMTQKEFEKNPVISETAIFYYLFRNMIEQTVEESYIEDEKLKKKMLKLLKNSEIIQILSDICNPMRVKALTESDLNHTCCCGPFPNLKLD